MGIIGAAPGVAIALAKCTPGQRLRVGDRGDSAGPGPGGGGLSIYRTIKEFMR